MSVLLDRLAAMDRKVLVAGIALFLLIAAGAYYLFSSGGEEGQNSLEDPKVSTARSESLVVPIEPLPVMLEESVVEERVAATMAALAPTPTPTALPDLAATLQAELVANREKLGRVLVLSPLDSEEVRNPYLNPSELEYMTELGGRIWAYTKVWLHLSNLLSVDVVDWTLEDVEPKLLEIRSIIESAPRRRTAVPADVGSIVLTYEKSIYEGIIGVNEAYKDVENGTGVLRDARKRAKRSGSVDDETLTLEERQNLIQAVRDAERSLEKFDRAMSAYGCSVCGELFRHRSAAP